MLAVRRAWPLIVSVLAFAGCGGDAPSGSAGTAPPGSPTAATSPAVVASPSPIPRFAAGDMLVVLAEAPLNGETDDGPFVHPLLPGDRVLVLSGPGRYLGRDSYEVSHHGIAAWVPVFDGARQLVAFDAPAPGARVLDLVKFGDSSTPSPDLWVLKLEERLGVEVRATDYFARAGGTPAEVLRLLKDDAEVRAAVAGAEVIGLEMNPSGTTTGDAMGAVCVANDPNPRDPPPVFTVADFAEYADIWRQVYDEVFALRRGQPTLVRAFDMYVPVRDAWVAAGIVAACTTDWEAFSATVKLVAAEYKVPVASMYDAFNGPRHDQDPVDNGYLDTAVDDKHLNERGRIAQIAVLDALGYDFATR
jgi:hypothetical protein